MRSAERIGHKRSEVRALQGRAEQAEKDSPTSIQRPEQQLWVQDFNQAWARLQARRTPSLPIFTPISNLNFKII